MNITDYLIQQSDLFNKRMDQIEKLVVDAFDKLEVIEYNIQRMDLKIDQLDDKPIGGFDYERYVER